MNYSVHRDLQYEEDPKDPTLRKIFQITRKCKQTVQRRIKEEEEEKLVVANLAIGKPTPVPWTVETVGYYESLLFVKADLAVVTEEEERKEADVAEANMSVLTVPITSIEEVHLQDVQPEEK